MLLFPLSLHLVLFTAIWAPSSTLAQLPLPSPPFLPPPASSGATPSNSTTSPNPQWINLLGDLLWFYEAQRSGSLPSSNRVSWRNDSALKDVPAGGYYDAGDYLKFTYPLSFTLTSICWGALNYGQGYTRTNQTPYLDAMLRWGLDWLMNAHRDNNTLIVQVGDVKLDQKYWGGDRNLPQPRPSYQINATHPGTDAAAAASAAFTSCSALYANQMFLTPQLAANNYTNLSSVLAPTNNIYNKAYAETLFAHGDALYTFATNTTKPQQVYQAAVPSVSDSYPSSGYKDDLVLAGLFLAAAAASPARARTDISTRAYSAAKQLWEKEFKGHTSGALNWDAKTPILPVLGAQIATMCPQQVGAGSGDLAEWRNVADNYFDGLVSGKLTDGGLLWYNSHSSSLNPALNAAMLINQYLPLVTDLNKANNYFQFATKQLNYALGANPMSMPYIVGVNPNSPVNPHSAMASGGTSIKNIDTNPINETHVLYGAVVGGPDEQDRFWDIRSDYPQTEVALHYNAPMLTLAAISALINTDDPYYTKLKAGAYNASRPKGAPCDAAIKDGCPPHMPMATEIAMAVSVGVVGLVILGLLIYLSLGAGGRRAP